MLKSKEPEEKRIWVPDAAQIWRLSYIIKKDEAAGTVTVEPLKGGAPVEFRISETHGFDPSHESDLDDAAQLNNLHEAPLLDLITRRFKKDKIYTNVGGVLISVNPYKFIPYLYSLRSPGEPSAAPPIASPSSSYRKSSVDSSASAASSATGYSHGDEDELQTGPHVYLIAQQAIEAVEQSKVLGTEICNQSVVISGESGAGKTEASKHVMRYLINQSLKKELEIAAAAPVPRKGPRRRGSVTAMSKHAIPDPSLAVYDSSERRLTDSLAAENPLSNQEGDDEWKRIREAALVAMEAKATEQVNVGGSADIESKLMQSNVILEAFGNAKTVRNDNSSRFGKYIKLQYNSKGRMVQARTMHFLLEKSRLVSVAEKERNYHVFYQMCEGLGGTSFADKLKLKKADKYSLCNMGGCIKISDDVDDSKEFRDMKQSLVECGVSNEELDSIWELLAAMLQLGDVSARTLEEHEDEEAMAYNPREVSGSTHKKIEMFSKNPDIGISFISDLFGIEEAAFQKACTTHSMSVKDNGSHSRFEELDVDEKDGERKKKITVPLTTQQAVDSVLALVKYSYSELFSWLVCKINEAHASATSKDDLPSFIGILDIFGFEIMRNNSFEQLCINFANEVLQQQFNEHIFVREQEMYREEGLDWSQINFHDNQGLIDLIGKKPKGLLPICEEHVMLSYKRPASNSALLLQLHNTHAPETSNKKSPIKPYSSQHSTSNTPSSSQGFSHSKNHQETGNPFYVKPKLNGDIEFIIKHFAGNVTYNVTGFVEKNRDSLNIELKEMLQSSRKPFIKCSLFGLKMIDEVDKNESIVDIINNNDAVLKETVVEEKRKENGLEKSKKAKTGAGIVTSPSSTTSNNKPMISKKVLAKGKSAGANSVSLRFREQLEELTKTLRSTQPHYIKCIKPNSEKVCDVVDSSLIVQQLRYSGVLEVVRIRREAYPTRLGFNALHQAFDNLVRCAFGGTKRGNLSFDPWTQRAEFSTKKESREACVALTRKFLKPVHYQVGKTMVFFRQDILKHLYQQEKDFFLSVVVEVQSWSRGVKYLRVYRNILRAIRRIQCIAAGYADRLLYLKALRRIRMIQSLARMQAQLKRYRYVKKCIRTIQSKQHSRLQRKWYLKAIVSSILIQKVSRGAIQRRKYRMLLLMKSLHLDFWCWAISLCSPCTT